MKASNAVDDTNAYLFNTWLIDSGASDHMTGNRNLLSNLRTLKSKVRVGLPDGSIKTVNEVGNVQLKYKLVLNDVFYISDFKHNLLSVSKLLQRSDLKLLFDKDGCLLQGLSTEQNLKFGKNVNDLYTLISRNEEDESRREKQKGKKVLAAAGEKRCQEGRNCNKLGFLNLTHARLGHASVSKMKHLDFCKCKDLKEYFCDICCVAKHHKLPFTASKSIAEKVFDLLHVDLWGPYRTKALTGATYFLTIVDDFSRATWTHLLSNKEQVKEILNGFLCHVENQFNTRVKILRSDNGTEIFQSECGKMFTERGIIHQRSVQGVPQQNARVERKHRFLLETARALKLHAGLPSYLWGECILAATHLINMLPSAVIN